MQPKFTLRNLGSLFTKSFALTMLFFVSAHFAYSQQPTNLAKPRPIVKQVESKPLTKLQKEQNNNWAVTDNGSSLPNQVLDNNKQQTEAVCTTYTGTLAAGDPTFTSGRLTRNGVPSVCGPAKACPGNFNVGTVYRYKTFTYTNPQAVAQCMTVNHTNTGASGAPHLTIHNGPFDPANICTNFIGDQGASPNPTFTGTYQVTIPGSATITLVVTETAVDGFGSFSISLDGICTPCTPTAATAPTISSVPSTTCAGSPITLNILSGNLNGAANWVWYSGSVTSPSIGSGTSITVSPVANTTYFARGEGGCAPAPGAAGSQLVTVTPCSCISPDLATICAGSVQRLTINQTLPPTLSAPFVKVGAIAIPGTGTGAGTGAPANPYPDALAVSGLPIGATVSSVTINGFTHTFPSDVDIVLRSPAGQSVILMSDAGGGTDALGLNLTFSDAAATVLPAALVTGTFRPTNAAGPDNFPAPGPGTITQVNPALSSFAGLANGNWELFVVDDLGGDIGTISGWSMTFSLPATTATWTPVATLFTDPAGTIPYVTGTPASVVYAKPTATGATAYVATINNGPCAGVNNVTVNVLPTPVVTVSPNPGGCSPATLTASGASIYNWSPAAGLNTTTGATVIATTPVNASYTVNGFGANGCAFAPVVVPVTGSSTAAVISSLGAPPTIVFAEGFEATSIPAGWAQQNLSTPVGTVPTWIFGTATVLSPAQNGSPNSYVLGNFNNVAGNNTISNWLFTPTTTLANGDQLVFYTRTVAAPAFPDRLQVRMSTNGASVDVGTSNTSVGDFSALLLDINPGLTTAGYPASWTQFTATVAGLSAPISGRLAFRYFVTSGGPAGANSDNVGIDNVTYQKPALATCAFNTSSIKVDITGGTSPYSVIYSDGTTNRTVNGYASGTPIQVTPGVTTTYTIVSVTGSNGCAGSGNTGSAVITVTPPPSITTQPVNRTACAGFNTTFTVSAGPVLGTNFQWQVSTNGGTSYTNLVNAAPYSGVTTATLTITGATTALNLNRYRVVITGACPPNSVTSTGATLFVNDAPLIVTQPVATTKCVGTPATFTVVASTPNGPAAPTYQWQVSINSGLTYTNITGATSATLTIASVAITMNNNLYQCIVTTAPCAATVTSAAVKLTVNTLPVITIASPVTQLVPGRTATLTATSTPGPATPASFTWTRDGVTVTGATTSSIVVDIDKIGTYRATVTDNQIPGCTNSSNNLVIGTEASDYLWIYPNPTDGAFQVRLYFPNFNTSERREVSVWNANGQLVARKSLDFIRGMSPYSQVNFDLSGQAPGTYLVKVTEKSTEKIVSGLLIIQ